MVWSEGNVSLKNSVTPPGVDPGTVRLVAQRLNHYATPGPPISLYSCKIVDKEILCTVSNIGVYCYSDKVGAVNLVKYVFKNSELVHFFVMIDTVVHQNNVTIVTCHVEKDCPGICTVK